MITQTLPEESRPLPIFVGLMVETSHPQNRIIGEIPDSWDIYGSLGTLIVLVYSLRIPAHLLKMVSLNLNTWPLTFGEPGLLDIHLQ